MRADIACLKTGNVYQIRLAKKFLVLCSYPELTQIRRALSPVKTRRMVKWDIEWLRSINVKLDFVASNNNGPIFFDTVLGLYPNQVPTKFGLRGVYEMNRGSCCTGLIPRFYRSGSEAPMLRLRIQQTTNQPERSTA